MARTPLITAPPADTPVSIAVDTSPGADARNDVTGWCHPPELSFAERLAVVSAVMQYGSERDREHPVSAAQRIAEGIVGAGWPLADGSARVDQPTDAPTKSGLE